MAAALVAIVSELAKTGDLRARLGDITPREKKPAKARIELPASLHTKRGPRKDSDSQAR